MDLKSATLSGDVKWVQSPKNDTYVVNFTDSTLEVNKFYAVPMKIQDVKSLDGIGHDAFKITIKNEKGNIIDDFTIQENEEDFPEVSQIFSIARKSAEGIDKIIKNMRKQLKRKPGVLDSW